MSETAPTFTRERPNPLLKFAFKIPPKIYWGPIAEFMRSRCVLRITTTGRKSGLPRTISLSFMPVDDRYIIWSGFGIESQWYQNVLANPEVTIKVGRKEMKATAAVVMDPERRRHLMLRMRDRSDSCGPPTFTRPLLRLSQAFDYDADVQMAVDNAEEMAVVELTPRS
jgi:deazaflavin-dependent oxidoreductase (nitroreductase family)